MESITEKMQKSDDAYTYAKEVTSKCVLLIKMKEFERALIEYRFMVENLKSEFKI